MQNINNIQTKRIEIRLDSNGHYKPKKILTAASVVQMASAIMAVK